MNKDVSNLKKHERFNFIHSVKTSDRVFEYIKKKLQNLTINIAGNYEDNILELMRKGLLEGWCWQTTESAIVFFEDDDCIERGNLKFEMNEECSHSWICFYFENKKFVFDPSFRILVEASIYYHVFEVSSVEGTVSAEQVKKDLLNRIRNYKRKESVCDRFREEYLSEKQKTEVFICENGDINSPMYNNNTGYNAVEKDGRIEILYAHYYVVLHEFQ